MDYELFYEYGTIAHFEKLNEQCFPFPEPVEGNFFELISASSMSVLFPSQIGIWIGGERKIIFVTL
jgi:hypothetical protein